jgi:membrane protein DedA with SNARE-associated domain
MTALLQILAPLMATYGYALIIVVILLESAGLPLPGEAVLVVAGAYAASGRLSIAGVILAAAFGAICGDTAGYWLGRLGGASVLRLFARHGSQARLEMSRAFFAKHGPRTVFLARFVPVLRVFGALLAGASAMDYRLFSLYNAAGGLAWAVLMGSIGFFFGYNIRLLESILHGFGVGLLFALLIGAGSLWLGRRLFKYEG